MSMYRISFIKLSSRVYVNNPAAIFGKDKAVEKENITRSALKISSSLLLVFRILETSWFIYVRSLSFC